jgi:SAM-dependent methyltransferase
MDSYTASPYVSFVESRLIPGMVRYGVFHRLTGEVLEPGDRARAVLRAAASGNLISLDQANLEALGLEGSQLQQLIEGQFLIPAGTSPLDPLMDYLVARPIQNPAVAYANSLGENTLVHMSMKDSVYSRRLNYLPMVIEETLTPVAAEILSLSDGTRTLREVFSHLEACDGEEFESPRLKEALDFLTEQDHQLIKLTANREDLPDPFKPVNTVPRNLVHDAKWSSPEGSDSERGIVEFHVSGIEDPSWEFDLIEPTINHSFRFPDQMLGGLDYGSRFCVSTLDHNVLPWLDRSERLEVLEVGAGTGSFAKSFIETCVEKFGRIIEYHIVDLSPALAKNQQELLSSVVPAANHHQQDATELDLHDQKFHLIIANEVIADFPVAPAYRKSGSPEQWQGDGASYIEKYQLSNSDAPESILINTGAMRFIERAHDHLHPGGTLIISEYGRERQYPTQSHHLNHEEFSIHFGHLRECGARVGFDCQLLTLKDFLDFDDTVPVLNGREEHILCLNQVLHRHGKQLPFAVISKAVFEREFEETALQVNLTGYSFSPLKDGYHFGPRVDDFMVLILIKRD